MNQLARYEAARTALSEAHRIDEVKDIRDKAQAMAAYARQRNDVEMERWIAEIKLRACVRIGELSKDLEKAPHRLNGNSSLPANGKTAKAEVLRAAGISTSAAQRYEKLADNPERVERYIAEKSARGEPVTIKEALNKPHVSHNSGQNEWYTPPAFIEAAREAMGGIDLDPASSVTANATVKAAKFFTPQENGLAQRWHGRVWMNPPYSQPQIAQFADAVSDKFDAKEIEQACVLVNNATETGWFQRMLVVSTAICLPWGRIRYWRTSGESLSPLQGQAIIYMGERTGAFLASFKQFGWVSKHG